MNDNTAITLILCAMMAFSSLTLIFGPRSSKEIQYETQMENTYELIMMTVSDKDGNFKKKSYFLNQGEHKLLYKFMVNGSEQVRVDNRKSITLIEDSSYHIPVIKFHEGVYPQIRLRKEDFPHPSKPISK